MVGLNGLPRFGALLRVGRLSWKAHKLYKAWNRWRRSVGFFLFFSNTALEQGIVAMSGIRIGADATIGMHCVMCSNSVIGHDSDVGDYVFVGPGVSCSGSVIINNTTVGHHTVVGSALNVLNDLPSNVVAYGNPAQVVGTRDVAGESLFRKRVSLKDVK